MLTCARTNASEGKKCDTQGAVGVTCPHVVPGRGMFIKMQTAEQFIYYDVLISSLLESRPDLTTVYFDLACK